MNAVKALKVNTAVEVTVWKESDEDFEYIFQSSILAVTDDLFLIEEPQGAPEENLALMTTGVIVGVVVYNENKPVILYPTVFSRQTKTPRGYWLKMPADAMSETIQRRAHVRVEMALPIKLLFNSYTGQEQEIQGETMDISGGGMKFASAKGFSTTQDVEIYLNFYPNPLPDEEPDETLVLPATVIFSIENPKATGADDFFMTAVQFVDLPDKDVTKIMGECFKKELEKKRRNNELA